MLQFFSYISVSQVVELHEFSLDIKRGVYLATGLSLTQMDERIGEYRQQLEGETNIGSLLRVMIYNIDPQENCDAFFDAIFLKSLS